MEPNETINTDAVETVAETAVVKEETNGKKKRRGFFETVPGVYLESYLTVVLGQSILMVIYFFVMGIIGPKGQLKDFMDTLQLYVLFLGCWTFLIILLIIDKKYNKILGSFLKGMSGNNIKNLLIGFALGFVCNATCIGVAYMHGDIELSRTPKNVIGYIVLFVFVFIQSSFEEALCRGYMYHKFRKSYKKVAVAIIANSVFFGLLHLGNQGVTVLSLLNIIFVGFICTVMVYYYNSLWMAFSFHAMWNYTQNIIFGLPNSGNPSSYSILAANTDTVKNSFAYDTAFGVEGTIVATLVYVVTIVALIVIAKATKKQNENIWDEAEA